MIISSYLISISKKRRPLLLILRRSGLLWPGAARPMRPMRAPRCTGGAPEDHATRPARQVRGEDGELLLPKPWGKPWEPVEFPVIFLKFQVNLIQKNEKKTGTSNPSNGEAPFAFPNFHIRKTAMVSISASTAQFTSVLGSWIRCASLDATMGLRMGLSQHFIIFHIENRRNMEIA